MSQAYVTPSALRRREWAQPWTERLPRELLVLGRPYLDTIRRLRAGTGPRHKRDVDWEALYQSPSSEVSRGILAVLSQNTALAATSFAEWTNEAGLDRCLREFVRSITGAMNHPESIPQGAVKQARKRLEQELPNFRLEVRVTLDNVAALAFYRVPLALLLERAQQGDMDALEKLLRINPTLEARPWVRELMSNEVRSAGAQIIARLHAAVSSGLSVRQNKLLEVGALLLLLWPWLGRLTTNQRLGFLKDLGVPKVPSKKAMREYERWLGVKGLYAEGTQERQGSVAALGTSAPAPNRSPRGASRRAAKNL